ncbi:hypothetical protein DFJ58DRAFT_781615 [Suillus subalutaceus]|uniref:uncharacterized protein n=1 Tax=Suillus subalutaceus TaxID=48586 RepID=UPI001B868328|nr:uncharacterized protein DFJ58DRAFT_781615 [Suillus subalutaceus]KAG1858772.1 hypothetical protein DFJ58DRAFT_781615 [Suillus subalutaceus]
MLHSPIRSMRRMHIFRNHLYIPRSFRAPRFGLAVYIRRQQRIVIDICKLPSVSLRNIQLFSTTHKCTQCVLYGVGLAVVVHVMSGSDAGRMLFLVTPRPSRSICHSVPGFVLVNVAPGLRTILSLASRKITVESTSIPDPAHPLHRHTVIPRILSLPHLGQLSISHSAC